MKTWNTFTRREEILSVLSREKSVQVDSLSSYFQVSEVTIRSDLETLAKRGQLVRIHGGAVPAEDYSQTRNISKTINENRPVKESLARIAVSLVNDGDTIIIDSGSTMAIFAHYLHGKKITVLSNSLPVLMELAKDDSIELIVIGGSFRRSVMSAVGDFSSGVLSSINADMLFMGCSSFDYSKGTSCPNINEQTTKRLMIEASKRVCLVSDCSKSNRSSLVSVAGWKEIDYFITDTIPAEVKAKLENLYSVNVKLPSDN